MKKSILVELIAALFILLFVYTALSKFYEFRHFQVVLGSSPVIGKLAPIIAWLLPTTELIVAGLLLIPKTRLIGLWASFVLMILFTLYISYIILFAPKLPCSCGGVLKQLNWQEHLLFNVALSILAGIGIRLADPKEANQRKLATN